MSYNIFSFLSTTAFAISGIIVSLPVEQMYNFMLSIIQNIMSFFMDILNPHNIGRKLNVKRKE
jgi:hypothetical protein